MLQVAAGLRRLRHLPPSTAQVATYLYQLRMLRDGHANAFEATYGSVVARECGMSLSSAGARCASSSAAAGSTCATTAIASPTIRSCVSAAAAIGARLTRSRRRRQRQRSSGAPAGASCRRACAPTWCVRPAAWSATWPVFTQKIGAVCCIPMPQTAIVVFKLITRQNSRRAPLPCMGLNLNTTIGICRNRMHQTPRHLYR